jgi:hypothetical protein
VGIGVAVGAGDDVGVALGGGVDVGGLDAGVGETAVPVSSSACSVGDDSGGDAGGAVEHAASKDRPRSSIQQTKTGEAESRYSKMCFPLSLLWLSGGF